MSKWVVFWTLVILGIVGGVIIALGDPPPWPIPWVVLPVMGAYLGSLAALVLISAYRWLRRPREKSLPPTA